MHWNEGKKLAEVYNRNYYSPYVNEMRGVL